MSDLSSMEPVPRALRIATEAHAGQTDRAGKPYIWHCLSVMRKLEENSGSPPHSTARAAALLHDTIEDTDWEKSDLLERAVSTMVVSTVTVLTHQDSLSYSEYIERLANGSRTARRVKIADLRHNMDLTRLPTVTGEDIERVRKYRRALDTLLRAPNCNRR
jgi:(p)ppGpp synthase/HD superfamily hydrolase